MNTDTPETPEGSEESAPIKVLKAIPMSVALVRGVYNIQELRISAGNRICAQFRHKLGLLPGAKEESSKDAEKILEHIRGSFKKLTDGVKREIPTRDKFQGDNLISDYTELCLVAQYMALEKQEESHFKQLGDVLTEIPIWGAFFEGVPGCGPAMSGAILSVIDISEARYVSSLWQICGFGTGADGRAISRRPEHMVRRKYKDKEGVEKERDSLVYDPWLRSKLHVLAECMIKRGARAYTPEEKERRKVLKNKIVGLKENPRPDKDAIKAAELEFGLIKATGPYNGPYKKIYDDYRNRLDHSEKLVSEIEKWETRGGKKVPVWKQVMWKDARPIHRHMAARRYMIKRFLAVLYRTWRPLEGLEVFPEYSEAKLGIHHHGGQKAA